MPIGISRASPPYITPNFTATLARVYYKKGMYPDAEREIKRAIDLRPDDESYLALLPV